MLALSPDLCLVWADARVCGEFACVSLSDLLRVCAVCGTFECFLSICCVRGRGVQTTCLCLNLLEICLFCLRVVVLGLCALLNGAGGVFFAGIMDYLDDKTKKQIIGLKLTVPETWYIEQSIVKGIRAFKVDNFYNLKDSSSLLTHSKSLPRGQHLPALHAKGGLGDNSVDGWNQRKTKSLHSPHDVVDEKYDDLADGMDDFEDLFDPSNDEEEKNEIEEKDVLYFGFDDFKPSSFFISFLPVIGGNGKILKNWFVLKVLIKPPVQEREDGKMYEFICGVDGMIYKRHLSYFTSKRPDSHYFTQNRQDADMGNTAGGAAQNTIDEGTQLRGIFSIK